MLEQENVLNVSITLKDLNVRTVLKVSSEMLRSEVVNSEL